MNRRNLFKKAFYAGVAFFIPAKVLTSCVNTLPPELGEYSVNMVFADGNPIYSRNVNIVNKQINLLIDPLKYDCLISSKTTKHTTIDTNSFRFNNQPINFCVLSNKGEKPMFIMDGVNINNCTFSLTFI